MTQRTAAYYIESLSMERHPEGGFYVPAFVSDEIILECDLPERYKSPRPRFSSIYYLLKAEDKCRLHTLNTDEQWHFYDGGLLRLHTFRDKYEYYDMGRELSKGMSLQLNIEKDTCFGAEVLDGDFVLVGCSLSPAFSFEDHSWGNKKELIRTFPEQRDVIEQLAKDMF